MTTQYISYRPGASGGGGGGMVIGDAVTGATPNYVLYVDGSGDLANEAALAKTRGGTGISSTATFPSSGVVATVPSSGVVHSDGSVLSASAVLLASEVSGTLPIANGGTGQTSAANAINALLPSQGGNSGKFLTTNGSVASWGTASTSVSIGTAIGSSTAGSVLFVDASNQLAQNNSKFFWDNSSFRLGIGNTSPQSPLDVTGEFRSSTMQVNESGSGGTNTSIHAQTSTGVSSYGSTALIGSFSLNAGSAVTSVTGVGVSGAATFNPSAGGVGADSASSFIAGRFTATQSGTGTVNNMTGILGKIAQSDAGTLSVAYGIQAYADISAGTVSDLRLLHVRAPANTGTITNLYGLYIDSMTAGGTTNEAIHVAGGTSNFQGTVKIGSASGTLITTSGTVSALAGTTTTVLHGNAAGAPTFGAVSLTADVSGVLPIANGGTNNGSLGVTNGGVIYADGSKLANSGAGTSGQFLQSAGSAAPVWAYSNNFPFVAKTGNYTLTASDATVTGDATSAAFTLTLPTAASISGRVYTIKKIDSSVNAVTVATTSSQTIDGSTSRKLMTLNESLTVVSDGSNWIIRDHKTITPWTSFTPTGSWSTNVTYTGYWRRVGDALSVVAKIAVTGQPDNTGVTVNIPNSSSWTIDATKTLFSSSASPLGRASIRSAGTSGYQGNVGYNNTTSVEVDVIRADGTYSGGLTALSRTVPATFANGDSIEITYSVPMTDWFE